MGRRDFMLPSTPALPALYYNLTSVPLGELNGYHELEVGKVYDIVIQHHVQCYGSCDGHSFHLHGAHFWHLGTFRGEWTGSSEQISKFNLVDPSVRDTIQTVSEGVGNKPAVRRPCGYTVIRFSLEGPGVWPFHCHHLAHLLMGQMQVFHTKGSTIPPPPDNLLTCGDMAAPIKSGSSSTVPKAAAPCPAVKQQSPAVSPAVSTVQVQQSVFLDSFQDKALLALIVISGSLALLIMINLAQMMRMKTKITTMSSQIQAAGGPTILTSNNGK